MPAEPNEQERHWDAMERETVYLLTDPERYPSIWSVPDIGRQIDYFDPESVIRPLRNAGLIHQTVDGFVFATPAAFRMVQMVGQVV
jgi:antirestriction protein